MYRCIRGSKGDNADDDFADIKQKDSNNPDGTAEFQLPTYDNLIGRSKRKHLNPTNISDEIGANYLRGRSMLNEIARRKRPWTSFVFKNQDRIKLEEPASKLDNALYGMIYDRTTCIRGGIGYEISLWFSEAQKSSKYWEECDGMEPIMKKLILNDSEVKASLGKLLTPRENSSF